MKTRLLAGLVSIWAGAAMAHSPLEATTPAANAVVDTLPETLMFEFKDGIRLTRVTMTHGEHDGVDLDVSGHDGFVSDYAVPIAAMGNGVYLIEWRGLGVDGHAMNGSFRFTVE